jgi:hypothetical protein
MVTSAAGITFIAEIASGALWSTALPLLQRVHAMLQIDQNDPLHAIKALKLPGFRSSQPDSDDARSDALPEATPPEERRYDSTALLTPDPNEPLDVAAALGMPGFKSTEERRARMARGAESASHPTDEPQAVKPAPSPAPLATTQPRSPKVAPPAAIKQSRASKPGYTTALTLEACEARVNAEIFKSLKRREENSELLARLKENMQL